MLLPYDGRCPYDNTFVDITYGGEYSIWYCQNGHEWNTIEAILVPDRCNGSFKYGNQYDTFCSLCLWCGQLVEHYPFFHREMGNMMKFHRLNQPQNFVLEAGETFYFSEARHFGVRAVKCNGCQKDLQDIDLAQIVTDRLGKRQFVIHLGCWHRLVDTLERSE